MHISIIVPIYNEAAGLPAFLDSIVPLLDADTEGLELVVVDGGSDDGGPAIAAARGCSVLRAPRGRAAQMNAGETASSGELLLFLHADTRLDPRALQRARTAVRDGAVGGYFDVRLDSRRPLLRLTGTMITWRSRLTGVASGDQAIFVTREAFRRLGGYAPLPLFEDLDLCRRLQRLGRVVALDTPVITSPRRWESFGVWPTILRMWALRALYYAGVSPERLARYYGLAR